MSVRSSHSLQEGGGGPCKEGGGEIKDGKEFQGLIPFHKSVFRVDPREVSLHFYGMGAVQIRKCMHSKCAA